MFCEDCGSRDTCGKLCSELHKYLTKEQAKDGYSDRHYRRKIWLYPLAMLEKIATKRAFHLELNIEVNTELNIEEVQID